MFPMQKHAMRALAPCLSTVVEGAVLSSLEASHYAFLHYSISLRRESPLLN